MHTEPHTSGRTARERAVTMMELLAVLVIVAILMALGVWAVGSARSSGEVTAGVAVANAYGNAIDQFARDHSGRFPDGPGSAEWPEAAAGPRDDSLGVDKGYLRSVPQAVTSGQVSFHGSSDAEIELTYERTGDGYALVIAQDGEELCAVGAGNLGGREPCSNR